MADLKGNNPGAQGGIDRRTVLLAGATTTVGLFGAAGSGAASAAQAAGSSGWAPDNASLPPEIRADIERRSKLKEELTKPAGLRPNAQLDGRFPVSYQTSVAQAMKYVVDYFAAFASRDVAAVAKTLHFPYATYEGIEPLVYRNEREFIENPPPSLNVTTGQYKNFMPGVYDMLVRPGTYDIMDNLQLRTYNPVNVGIELCYTRYNGRGETIGINQGIYGVTNNDGKWGIQLSSIIFTPSAYIGIKYNDAVESHLRRGRTGMMAWSVHDAEMLRRSNGGTERRRTERKSASIAAPPGTDHWIRAARAGTPMQPYNTKGRISRLSVSGEIQATRLPQDELPHVQYNMKEANGEDGYFYELASGGVGKYAYTLTLPDSQVLHAGPEKAHTLGGYIRYTADGQQITETRSLGIMVYDGVGAIWEGSGGFGQTMRRDCTNDPDRTPG
jgi:hypothetical protein